MTPLEILQIDGLLNEGGISMSEEEVKEAKREVKLEMDVLEERKNDLLHRQDIKLRIRHEFAPSPDRLTIKAKIAAKYAVSEDRVIIKQMKNYYGTPEEICTVYIYDSIEILQKIEPSYLRIRNMPKEERKEAIKALKAKKKKKKKKAE